MSDILSHSTFPTPVRHKCISHSILLLRSDVVQPKRQVQCLTGVPYYVNSILTVSVSK